jgi:hypothetical protein
MHDRDPEHWHPAREDHPNDDHWEMFAEAMDLTIEGHRLIAQEIGYELRLLWRGIVGWFRDITGAGMRGRASRRSDTSRAQ